MKAWIPNTITLFNLFCGCAAIVSLLAHQWWPAFWLFVAAIFFDFIDGLVARLLGVSSEHGKELDSLADMVSFGVVPGVIYYVFLDLQSSPAGSATAGFNWLAAPGLLVTLFSALRLAKFNLDTRQTDDFIGLATPSSTLFAMGLLLIHATDAFGWKALIIQPALVYTCVLLMSYLLVVEIPMFSFKMKNGFAWSGNQPRYIFVAAVVLLLFFLRWAALPFIVITYLILNVATWLLGPKSIKS